MKKIIVFLLITIFSFSSVFSYTESELESKKNVYKNILTKKFENKLEKFSEKKLKKIIVLIDKYILKYENDEKKSDIIKLNKIAILIAFREIINEKLDKNFWDINNILNESNKKTEIIMITDKRCWDSCALDPIITQLRQIPDLSNAKIIKLDYDEEEAKDILLKNWIIKLPAAIFEENSIKELSNYLVKTKDWKYSLELGWTFNPYEKRSKKWFRTIDKKILYDIKKNSYIKWNKNSEILWLEYSDMECPFCAKLHNSGIKDELYKKYNTKLSYSLQHFPLDFHKNAFSSAQALECIAKQKWERYYFELEDIIFSEKKSDIDFVIDSAVNLWANKEELKKCIENKEFSEKIYLQQKQWVDKFWITWTPWNVLININTWEYEVISGAYPASSFIEIIDRLLK